jgi:8-oxo-dGTP diphosphatase
MSGKEYPDSPRIAIGAVVFKEGRVLLVRRNQAPAYGLWSIPGGSVELGEDLHAATEREIREETGVAIRAQEPVYVFDFIDRDERGGVRYHYVIIDYLADFIEGKPQAGDDVSAAEWVHPDQLASMDVSARTLDLLRRLSFIEPDR